LNFASKMNCRRCAEPRPKKPNLPAKGTSKGDWYCPNCNDFQFAKNAECRKCQTPNPNPTNDSGSSVVRKPGDWNCPNCNELQFARNAECRSCGTPNPNPDANCKPGDWRCPNCNDLQFARNEVCRRCNTPNPNPDETAAALRELAEQRGDRGDRKPVEKKPGDWFCPACGDLQFSKNDFCRKCQAPRPMMMMGGKGGFGGKGMGGGMMGMGKGMGKGMMDSFGNGKGGKGGYGKDFGKDFGKGFGMAKGMAKSFGGGKGGGRQMLPGDWNCPSCGDLVFARNSQCRRCDTPRPDRGVAARSRSPRRY